MSSARLFWHQFTLLKVFLLLVASRGAFAQLPRKPAPVSRHSLPNFRVLEAKQPPDPWDYVWGFQTGPSNASSDAGGMVYDYDTDQVIVVGTTYDRQLFTSPAENGAEGQNVDCYIATVGLPPISNELSESQAAGNPELAAMAAQKEHQQWKLSGQTHVITSSLDRCDLVTSLASEDGMGGSHKHVFVGGTIAVATTDNGKDPMAVDPLIMEADIGFYQGSDEGTNKIETGAPLEVGVAHTTNSDPSSQPIKSSITIPTALTSYGHYVYLGSVKRTLSASQETLASMQSSQVSQNQLVMQISLVLTKFEVMDGANASLKQTPVWTREYPTDIVENRSPTGGTPVTSSLFYNGPGPNVSATNAQTQQSQVAQQMQQMESQQAAYEDSQLGTYRYQYRYDGVLISAIEVVDTGSSEDEAIMLVAGSAPGLPGNNTSRFPFMDNSQTFVGDWDGYITKVSARTGIISRPANYASPEFDNNMNTWMYRVASQPKHNDFVQSICVPRLPPGAAFNMSYKPSAVYVVGTTQGKIEGTQNGGAFVISLALDTMNVIWHHQIPGMNVHGLTCEVHVDPATAGIETEPNDVLYVAGEVHGDMSFEIDRPNGSGTTSYRTQGHGETDIWVAQFQTFDGSMNWIRQIGTPGQDRLAKSTNNPESVSGLTSAETIGDAGSGKGALVIDRHGNAVIFGTTQGSLAREKISGQIRDVFVLRLHKDDGSYQSVLPAKDNAIENDPNRGNEDGTTKDPGNVEVQHHRGINNTAVALGFVLPVVLTVLIILATRNSRPDPPLKEAPKISQEPTNQAESLSSTVASREFT